MRGRGGRGLAPLRLRRNVVVAGVFGDGEEDQVLDHPTNSSVLTLGAGSSN
ncbi:hypothetical protein [Massilia phosphatilytica]